MLVGLGVAGCICVSLLLFPCLSLSAALLLCVCLSVAVRVPVSSSVHLLQHSLLALSSLCLFACVRLFCCVCVWCRVCLRLCVPLSVDVSRLPPLPWRMQCAKTITTLGLWGLAELPALRRRRPAAAAAAHTPRDRHRDNGGQTQPHRQTNTGTEHAAHTASSTASSTSSLRSSKETGSGAASTVSFSRYICCCLNPLNQPRG